MTSKASSRLGLWFSRTIALRSVALELEDEARTIWLTIRDGVVNIIIIACVWFIVEVWQGPDFYYHNSTVSSLLTRRTFPIPNATAYESLPDFSGVATLPMLWAWLHSHVVPRFARPGATILLANRLLGQVRLRQLRVRNNTCDVAGAFEGSFATCFGIFSEANEFMGPYGPGKGTAWTWSSATDLDGDSFTGEVAMYGGGGYFVDVPLDELSATEMLEELDANHWLDEATRVLFVDINLYNPDSNVFTLVKVYVEMPPTGGLLPWQLVSSIKLLTDYTAMQSLVLTCHVLLLACSLWTLYMQCGELVFWGLTRYFLTYATHLHLTGIILAIYVAVLGIYNEFEAPQVALRALTAPHFTDLLSARYAYDSFRLCAILLLALSWARLLFLSDFGEHSKLTLTLYRAVPDALSFFFMFIILVLSFSMLANMVFGSNLYEFRSFSNSVYVLLYVIPGFIKFETLFESSPILGPIFFVAFVFVVVYVLFNMFIVILNDGYFCVRDKNTEEREMFELQRFALTCLRNLCRRLHIPPLPPRRPRPEPVARPRALRTLLLQCKMPKKNVNDFMWRLSEGGKVHEVGRKQGQELAASLRKQQFADPASWEFYSRLLRRVQQVNSGVQVLDSVLDQLIPDLR